ncbi:MAG: type II toxin-antitoxin system VapC family toxin [Verrucomicrobia bacterium]|nr:type II toxin-antitoxin system VapC family toxin [Candidatus Woesearchaeota archaeon]MBM3874820.1 type II toxin-antitoxin system VapC family toxin [Verrucomicrobiota bacterium]
MRETVYLETSFFSFYFDERPAPAIVARREWTHQWWTCRRRHYELLTSTAVLDELARGRLPHQQPALDFALSLPTMPVADEVVEIVEAYIAHRLMPRDPVGDALHLALASFHKCDFLLTWNCQHLANASKFAHIRRLHAIMALHVPALVTPLELMEDSTDETR